MCDFCICFAHRDFRLQSGRMLSRYIAKSSSVALGIDHAHTKAWANMTTLIGTLPISSFDILTWAQSTVGVGYPNLARRNWEMSGTKNAETEAAWGNPMLPCTVVTEGTHKIHQSGRTVRRP